MYIIFPYLLKSAKLKIKCILCIVISIASSYILHAQAPEIEWQHSFGGELHDWLYSIDQTIDGGYILGGHSNSDISGDKIDSSRGSYDYWIIKLDPIGIIEWQKTIGGSNTEQVYDIHQTSDSGYIVFGYSSSNISGEKTENSKGLDDYWVVKLNPIGDIEWQKTIGGAGSETGWCVQQTTDGGYIVGGRSNSGISGDKINESFGSDDYWILKLNSIGEIMWQKSYGGDQADVLTNLQQTSDGGYIIGGESISGISGDKSEPCIGGFDYWVIKTDSIGDIEWQNTIGGNSDDRFRDILQTSDGGYIIGGFSDSDLFGDKAEPSIGFTDYWVLKLNLAGEIEWQNTIGGDSYDALLYISQTNSGEYLLAGQSNSGISGDKTEANFGGYDWWILKLSASGDINWQKELGGTQWENPYEFKQTSDGGYIICGFSQSGISGNKTDINQGQEDYWVVKLQPDCVEKQESCNGMDDDCDGEIDEGFIYSTYYLDLDGDNFGNVLIDSVSCAALPGYVLDNTDCDDEDPEIYPGAPELPDGIDNNCNQFIDEGLNSINSLFTENVKLFPNPNMGYFKILINSQIEQEIEIQLFSLTGEELKFNSTNYSGEYQLTLQNPYNGLAIVYIRSSSLVYAMPINIISLH